MLLSDFDYELPEELIAQEPLADRAGARMLVVDRATGRWADRQFRELPEFLRVGDCLVMNNSRVFPSRLLGRRIKDGRLLEGEVEVFLTKPVASDRSEWKALVNPGRKMLIGQRVWVSDELLLEVTEHREFGERTVRLETSGELYEVLERVGHVPLPPYIHRADTPGDRERYQTVFADRRGSVAAPTAGLHFTPDVLLKCGTSGAEIAEVTLHVGLGTFQPLRTNILDEVQLHHETFEVPVHAVEAMDRAKRVIAVGTTSVRAMESQALMGAQAETNLFIQPGFVFRRTGAMLTNFHLPKSSLLVLVGAFAGKDLALAAYRHAVEQRYRFFSYGDCMLII
ncbi:MAG: tRNA preQ1(34) S-adenosylmethionine ribosyltransferase-isomerase QueA [Acidobacteriota bacterium]